jgi:RNA polymerase sigma-70 factor (ECF subfamily)
MQHPMNWQTLHHQLTSYVLAKVKDRPLAEDIVQDVLVKVHTKSNQLKEQEKISGWVYRIAQHAVFDYYRVKARAAPTPC